MIIIFARKIVSFVVYSRELISIDENGSWWRINCLKKLSACERTEIQMNLTHTVRNVDDIQNNCEK